MSHSEGLKPQSKQLSPHPCPHATQIPPGICRDTPLEVVPVQTPIASFIPSCAPPISIPLPAPGVFQLVWEVPVSCSLLTEILFREEERKSPERWALLALTLDCSGLVVLPLLTCQRSPSEWTTRFLSASVQILCTRVSCIEYTAGAQGLGLQWSFILWAQEVVSWPGGRDRGCGSSKRNITHSQGRQMPPCPGATFLPQPFPSFPAVADPFLSPLPPSQVGKDLPGTPVG